jgi:nickel-dependent lactate racemase
MKTIAIPYGNETLPLALEEGKIEAVLNSKAHEYKAALSETELIEKALQNPVASPSFPSFAGIKKIYCSSRATTPAPCRAI